MAHSPFFSVVTVTLNAAEKAAQTARSVLEQTFGDYEYIVKDGGSTDDTVRKLRELGSFNIQVCRDSGIYNAMNQALRCCSGKYVCFLNAGDVFTSESVPGSRLPPTSLLMVTHNLRLEISIATVCIQYGNVPLKESHAVSLINHASPDSTCSGE